MHLEFIKIRKNKLLTKETLYHYIDNSTLLNSIFKSDDPELITNNIQLELNTIINTIAPPKVVQYRKNYVPYYNDEIRNKLIESQNLLNKAIKTYQQDDWRNFKHFRNNLSKDINNAKSKYIKDNFKDKSKQWKSPIIILLIK